MVRVPAVHITVIVWDEVSYMSSPMEMAAWLLESLRFTSEADSATKSAMSTHSRHAATAKPFLYRLDIQFAQCIE